MNDDAEHSDDREDLKRRRRARAEAAGYDVGYAKPPKGGKFKKGHQRSRGPRSRKSPITSVERYAAISRQKIAIIKDGRKQLLSRAEVIDLSTHNDAANGIPHARKIHYQKQKEIDALQSLEKQARGDDDCSYLFRRIEEMARRRAEVESNPELRDFINAKTTEKPQPKDTKGEA